MNKFLIGFFCAVYIFIGFEVFETLQNHPVTPSGTERSVAEAILQSVTWPISVAVAGSLVMILDFPVDLGENDESP